MSELYDMNSCTRQVNWELVEYIGKIHELPEHAIHMSRCKVSRWEFSDEKWVAVLNRTGTAPVAIHGNVRLSRTSCSLHPVFLHFSRKYHHLPTNILGRTFRPPWAFCILESFKKTVAPAGYKNKQTVSRRRYLARVLSSLMYRYALRQSASVPRFLYPAKGYGII